MTKLSPPQQSAMEKLNVIVDGGFKWLPAFDSGIEIRTLYYLADHGFVEFKDDCADARPTRRILFRILI